MAHRTAMADQQARWPQTLVDNSPVIFHFRPGPRWVRYCNNRLADPECGRRSGLTGMDLHSWAREAMLAALGTRWKDGGQLRWSLRLPRPPRYRSFPLRTSGV